MANNNYDDIIDLPHHVSSRHARMSRENRAAQFAPFAALTGYDASVREEARLTGEKLPLIDEQIDIMNAKMAFLTEKASEHPEISLTYFLADDRKEGGKYVTVTDRLNRIDTVEGVLILSKRNKIALDDILNVESEIFENDIFSYHGL